MYTRTCVVMDSTGHIHVSLCLIPSPSPLIPVPHPQSLATYPCTSSPVPYHHTWCVTFPYTRTCVVMDSTGHIHVSLCLIPSPSPLIPVPHPQSLATYPCTSSPVPYHHTWCVTFPTGQTSCAGLCSGFGRCGSCTTI